MAGNFIDELKQRFAFDEWATPRERDENVFLLRFHPDNAPLEKWSLQHAVVVEAIEPQPKALRGAEAKDDVRATDSVWTQDGDASRALHMTTYECTSREDARRQLLRVLAELQSPVVERADKVAGEVAFQMPKKTMALFVRGNLVVLMRNAGEKVVNVVPTARTLDEQLTAAPPSSRGANDIGTMKVGKKLSLALPKAAPDASLRIVTRGGGEVRVIKGTPVFEPRKEGEHEIAVVAMRRGEGTATRTRVTAK